MTATDELRKMLDERGVKWTGTHQGATFWCGEHGLHWMAYETSDGRLDLCTSMINATPAQAIEATLGRGELERENAELRELVRDYDSVLDAAVDVWGIMADVLGYGSKYDALHDRMRELGVEVD